MYSHGLGTAFDEEFARLAYRTNYLAGNVSTADFCLFQAIVSRGELPETEDGWVEMMRRKSGGFAERRDWDALSREIRRNGWLCSRRRRITSFAAGGGDPCAGETGSEYTACLAYEEYRNGVQSATSCRFASAVAAGLVSDDREGMQRMLFALREGRRGAWRTDSIVPGLRDAIAGCEDRPGTDLPGQVPGPEDVPAPVLPPPEAGPAPWIPPPPPPPEDVPDPSEGGGIVPPGDLDPWDPGGPGTIPGDDPGDFPPEGPEGPADPGEAPQTHAAALWKWGLAGLALWLATDRRR